MEKQSFFKNYNITIYPNHSVYIVNDLLKLEKAENEFIQMLLDYGLVVTITAFCNYEPNSTKQGVFKINEKINFLNLGVFYNNISIFYKLIKYLKSIWHVYKSVKNSRFNYIFFPGNISYITVFICLLLKKPYGLYVRGIWNQSFLFKFCIKFAFRNARFMLTTGPAFKEMLLSYNHKVEEVVPMINIPSSFFNKPVHSSHSQKGKIIIIARLTKDKGLFVLFDALSQLTNKGLRVSLDVVGGGNDSEVNEVLTYIRKNNLQTLVTLHGHISSPEKLAQFLLDSSVFVLPTTYPEGFPRVIYEAMLLKVPVVTSEMPGAIGFLINEKNCLIIDAKSSVQLASQIERLFNDEELYNKLVTNAHDLTINKFKNLNSKHHSDQVIDMLKLYINI